MNNIETPFSKQETLLSKANNKVRYNPRYIVVGVCALIFSIAIIFSIKEYASDRFRTLEPVDADELLSNHERLLGGKFKLMATVDAELGIEPGKGKLVAFRDAESQKIIPVLIISEELTSRTLSKGQRYKMEVEVTRGGLLQLNHLEKD